ncbi:MAG: HupE/UreJ family protein [Planctomycetes bacterium]|nr:HupE/UreJ family protein [Planctomycetota bacterium]
MSRILSALVLALALPAFGHELRPAYLELIEAAPGEFRVLWKTPMRGEMRLSLAPEFTGRTEEITPIVTRQGQGAAVQTWRLKAVDPLPGQSIRIAGLEGTMTDALVRVEFADGSSWGKRLTPAAPAAQVPAHPNAWTVAGDYLAFGVEHILTGIDHLLFVFALILITRGGWLLVKTVTAFTVSHSITLSAAALGWVRVPQRPIEALIALSIALVAVEIVRLRQGREGLTSRAPWLAALAFGLLHGFGFAGGLREAGLPDRHIPQALLCFSAGVEIGHFLFVGAAVCLITLFRRLKIRTPAWAHLVPPYAIGSVAMFWAIQRIAAF